MNKTTIFSIYKVKSQIFFQEKRSSPKFVKKRWSNPKQSKINIHNKYIHNYNLALHFRVLAIKSHLTL